MDALRENQMLATVDGLRDDLVETLRSLVATNTVNPYSGEDAGGSEAEGQHLLQDHLARLGARTRLFEPAPDTFEKAGVIGPKDRSWIGRPNLVGEWDFGTGSGPSIIVMGHIDTVGVQGMNDPFGAGIRDGRMHGRGTTDCKGGLVSALGAIEALLPLAEDLNGHLIFLSVVDEECNGSGAGAIACIDEGIHADTAISVDGSPEQILRGCGGVITAGIKVHGQAGHGSIGNGVSAIEMGILIAQTIRKFGDARHSAFADCLLNIGTFSGGTHPAVIAGEAEITLNIVYHITEASRANEETGRWGGDLVWNDLVKAVRTTEDKDPWLADHPSDIGWIKDLVPYEIPVDSPVIRGMAKAAADVKGQPVPVGKMKAWTDACWFPVLGNIPISVYGPGDHGLAHGPHESLDLDDLMFVTKVLSLHLYRTLLRESAEAY